MNKDEMQEYLRRWERVAEEEGRLRKREQQTIFLPDMIRMFNGAFNQVMKQLPPRTTSGLVEQQALFGKLRHD